MDYEEIKLNVSNDKISEYKVFYGIKLYSDVFTSEDKKTLTSKRIYSTKIMFTMKEQMWIGIIGVIRENMILILIQMKWNEISYLRYHRT